MSDLIAKLEAATEGSRELDRMIGEHLGYKRIKPVSFDCWFHPAGFSGALPMWTTSIDAALPWENIVSVSRQMDGRWLADHHHQAGPNIVNQFSGIGKTEALARRIAALSGNKAREANHE